MTISHRITFRFGTLSALAFGAGLSINVLAQDPPAAATQMRTAPPAVAATPAFTAPPADTATPSATAPAIAATPASATPAQGDGLKIIDRKVGTGKEAASGKAAMVHYTGWLYDEKAPDNKGKQFDSSSTRGGLPFGFIIGVGRVIKGWDQGVVGMKVGGSRTLVVPAALAYGDKDVGGGLIPANSTLVFDIELVDTKP